MQTLITSHINTYKEELERIQEIQNLHPTYVEWDHIQNDLIPIMLLSAGLISLVFFSGVSVMKWLFPHSESKVIYKSAYQVTNLLVNLILGMMGIYYYNYVLEPNATVDTRVLGYGSVYPMSCVQFGYNLWAIPIGLTLIKESTEMIGHHFSVLIVSAVSATITTGSSYYAPFMYGILELSSIPLAVMNAFKDNPEYIKKYPSAYLSIRLIFAFSFLYIRWYLYLPLKYDFLRTFGMSVITQKLTSAMLFTGASWCAAFFLCLLQLSWGLLIIKGIVNVFFLKPRNKGKMQ